MLAFLDKLTSYIAPHECFACGVEGAPLCTSCTQLLPEIIPQCYRCHRTDAGSKTCKSCRKYASLQNVWIRTPYEGFSEELVKSLKFNRALQSAEVIAFSLYEQFAVHFPAETIFVPVPTASSRVRQRGYDQSVLVAKFMSKNTGLPCLQALVRSSQVRQTGSSRKQRLEQVENIFHIRHAVPASKHVVLVDDVLTTGATLESAAKTLKKIGARKISAVVFARAE